MNEHRQMVGSCLSINVALVDAISIDREESTPDYIICRTIVDQTTNSVSYQIPASSTGTSWGD